MKYVIFIPDGSSDYPVDELDGKTPLMVANTPNIDKLAKKGFGGFTNNVPEQYTPGSDVANMSIFGFKQNLKMLYSDAIQYSAKAMQWMTLMQATFPLKRRMC